MLLLFSVYGVKLLCNRHRQLTINNQPQMIQHYLPLTFP